MSSLPSGTITLLFTDIEGSTKLAQEHPDMWESLRERHHSILREVIDANRGYTFQIIGDAFCIAFHTASDGLNAAVDAQRKLQNEDWGDKPIQVRMGLHTGSAELHDTDYRGYLTLSLVQRLMSAGHGGQILMSNATENLLQGQLPKDVGLRDMGEHKFKDFPLPVRVFQVVAPDLQANFPALRALDVFPNNLRTQLTSFIGREKELADVEKLLQDAHLLTLIGPGGTGKTRLSIRSASESLAQYKDGVWLVELAPILDPLLVPRTTAIAIGLREEPQRPVIDALCDYLREKKMLIVLDNCEHLVNACAQMTNKILHAAPQLRILASSREALGIAGEVTYRVPSLGLPDVNHLPPFEALSQYEAVKLFIDRATSAIPSFAVTNESAPFLAQICYRLDGIPLAIELAAAKVRVLNLEQIAKRLDDRFHLLTGGSRTALERHQTLRATIDWSYNLLSDDEKMMFRRLSVFVGGWTFEAAEAVCDTTGILDLLTHLVDKSLVNVDLQQNIETRYSFLETVRQYAHEKLVESSEKELIFNKHFGFFLAFAESAESHLRSVEAPLWLKKFELEHNNLRAALQWSFDTNMDSGLHLVGTSFWFWYIRGYWGEGHKWAEDGLAHIADQARPAFRAQALFVLGAMAWNMSDYAAADTALSRSLALSQAADEKWWVAFTLLWLGWVGDYASDFLAARSSWEDALVLARALKDDWLIAELLRCLGMIVKRSDASAARPLLEESLMLSRKVGDSWLLAWVLISSAGVAELQGQHEQAVAFYEESTTWCRKIEDKGTLATAQQAMSTVLLGQGNIEKAEANLVESLALALEVGSYETIGCALIGLGGAAASRGQVKRAARLLATGEAVLNTHSLSISVWPNELAAYDRYIASLHSQIDEATFNMAWAEGSKMTLEQAIEYALQISHE